MNSHNGKASPAFPEAARGSGVSGGTMNMMQPERDGQGNDNLTFKRKCNEREIRNMDNKRKCVPNREQMLEDEVRRLKEVISRQNKEIKTLKNQLDTRQDMLTNQQEMSRKIQSLNEKYQLTVIETVGEIREIIKDMIKKNPETASPEVGDVAIGYERKREGLTHVGRECWIRTEQFNNLIALNDPVIFTRDLARILFGEDVLRRSTVTGRSSNRTGGARVEKLDGNKVNAIKDALGYFLSKKSFEHMSPAAKQDIINKVKNTLCSLIADIKRKFKKQSGNSFFIGPKITDTSSDSFENSYPNAWSEQENTDVGTEDTTESEQNPRMENTSSYPVFINIGQCKQENDVEYEEQREDMMNEKEEEHQMYDVENDEEDHQDDMNTFDEEEIEEKPKINF